MSGSSRPLRVAMVGLGQWGRRFAAKLQGRSDVELVAVVDAHRGRLAELGSARAGLRAFGGVEEMLESAASGELGLEAVFVAVSPDAQPEVGLRILEAGLPLFIEKPMALSSERAELLRRAALAKGGPVCVGHVVRYEPGFQRALDLVRAGELGKLRRIEAVRIGARPRPGVHPWWVLGPHELSRILALVECMPRPVSARRDDASTECELQSDGVSIGVCVAGSGTPSRRLVLTGERGRVVWDERTKELELELDGVRSSEMHEGDALACEIQAFLEAVRFGSSPPTDVEEGLRVVQLLEAVDKLGKLTVEIVPRETSTRRIPSTSNTSQYSSS